MNPNIILAVAFFNFLLGVLGRKTTMAIAITAFVYLAATHAYDNAISDLLGSTVANQHAAAYGLMGSFMLWSVIWVSSFANVFR